RLRIAEDMHWWLRLAAESDIGRVNRPTPALPRNHRASLTATVDKLHDLNARKSLFTYYFDGPGRALPPGEALDRSCAPPPPADARGPFASICVGAVSGGELDPPAAQDEDEADAREEQHATADRRTGYVGAGDRETRAGRRRRRLDRSRERGRHVGSEGLGLGATHHQLLPVLVAVLEAEHASGGNGERRRGVDRGGAGGVGRDPELVAILRGGD